MIEPTTTNSTATTLPPELEDSSASPATSPTSATSASASEAPLAFLKIAERPQESNSAAATTQMQGAINNIIKLIGRFLELLTAYLKFQGKEQGGATVTPSPIKLLPGGSPQISGQPPTTSGQTPSSGQTPTTGQTPPSGKTPVNTSSQTSNQTQTVTYSNQHWCSHTTTITTTKAPDQIAAGKNTAPGSGAASGSGSGAPQNTPAAGGNDAASGTETPSKPSTDNSPLAGKEHHDCCCPCPVEKPADNASVPEQTPPTPADKLKNVGSALGSSGEFLWKPTSEKDGKLAVLIPSSLTGKIDEVAIVSGDKKRVLQKGRYSGVGNGNRTHFRFSKSGDKFPDGSIVWIKLKDGTSRHVVINESSARYTK